MLGGSLGRGRLRRIPQKDVAPSYTLEGLMVDYAGTSCVQRHFRRSFCLFQRTKPSDGVILSVW